MPALVVVRSGALTRLRRGCRLLATPFGDDTFLIRRMWSAFPDRWPSSQWRHTSVIIMIRTKQRTKKKNKNEKKKKTKKNRNNKENKNQNQKKTKKSINNKKKKSYGVI
jgi:hypothetical protein